MPADGGQPTGVPSSSARAAPPMVCPWCGDQALQIGLVPGSWECGHCHGGFLPQRSVPNGATAETVVGRAASAAQDGAESRTQRDQVPVNDQHTMLDALGAGGMGTVVTAEHRGLRREVAMKILRESEDQRLHLRFIEEARITGQLEHPNIVPVHDLGIDRDSGRLFFTMKRVAGQTLEELLDEVREGSRVERTGLPDLLRVFIGTCNAIGFAHSRGVVHRDLKPANIMTGTYGEVLVMDWGLAKPGAARGGTVDGKDASRVLRALELDQASGHYRPVLNESFTLEGQIVGTIPYMPPEQAEGRIDEIDERSDIYALGAILYEILCLQPPVQGEPEEMLAQVIAGGLQPPQALAPKDREVPSELAAVAMQALAHDPEERYQTVRELRQDIHRYLENRSVSAKDDSAWEMVVKLLKRNRQVSAAVGIALAVILLLVTVGYRINAAARRVAEDSLQRYERAQVERAEAETAREESDFYRQVLVKQITRESRRDWTPVYHTVFDRRQDWRPTTGWHVVTPVQDEVVDEQVAFTSDGIRFHTSGNLHLVLQRSLSGDMRVRFDATYHGGEDGGMHFALGGNSWRSGYVVQVGGWRNTKCSVQRGSQLGVDPRLLESIPFQLEEGRRYRIDAYIVRSDTSATISLKIDGDQVFHLNDQDPLPSAIGSGNCFALMANGPAQTTIHELSIDALNEPLKVELIQVARRQLERGNYETAIDLFEELVEVQIDRERQAAARRGLETARRMQVIAGEVEACRERLASAWPTAKVEVTLNQEGMTVSFSGPDAVDLSALDDLPVTELRIENCPVSDAGPLADLPLVALHLFNTKVQDLTPLAGLELKHLLCNNRVPISLDVLRGMPLEHLLLGTITDRDLSALRGARLRELAFAAPALQDLSVLAGMPVSILMLRNAPLHDLAPLVDLPLERLVLSGCTQLVDISLLARIGSLRSLDLSDTGVHELGPLAGSKLEGLRLAGTPITDLGPLGGLPLQALDLARTGPVDLRPVASRLLRCLDLSDSQQLDIAALSDGRIGFLDLSGTVVQDLSPLAGHPVVGLDLRDAPVADLGPLQGAPLKVLLLSGSRVTDLDPVAACPLSVLDIGDTAIEDAAILGRAWDLHWIRLPQGFVGGTLERLREQQPEVIEGGVWESPIIEDIFYH